MKKRLEEIYTLLSDENRWTRGKYARNKEGVGVPPESEEAVCWCLTGAIERIGQTPNERTQLFIQLSVPLTGITNLQYFNDNCTHQELLQLIKEVIE